MQLSGSICIKLLKSGRAIFARKFTKSTLSDPHKVHTYFRLHTWINAFRFAFISLWNGGSRLSIITFTFAPHFIAPELFPYAIGFAIMQPCLYLNTRVRNPPTHMWEKKGSRKCETAGSFFRCSCQISTIAPRNCDKTSRQAALRQLLWQSNASYTFPPVNILDHINRHLKLDEKNCDSEIYLWYDYSAPCAKMSRLFPHRQLPSKFFWLTQSDANLNAKQKKKHWGISLLEFSIAFLAVGLNKFKSCKAFMRQTELKSYAAINLAQY